MSDGAGPAAPRKPRAPGGVASAPDNPAMSAASRALAPSFDARAFRQALGRFATGVTIVTARAADGRPVGLTASSFNAVSLEPPLVLWSLSLKASSMAVFAAGSHYAIHVLAADQVGLAERFATPGLRDRFQGLDTVDSPAGVPLLSGATAVFECFNRSQHREGDHVIFVGEVERCRADPGRAPLLYHGGRYYTELALEVPRKPG